MSPQFNFTNQLAHIDFFQASLISFRLHSCQGIYFFSAFVVEVQFPILTAITSFAGSLWTMVRKFAPRCLGKLLRPQESRWLNQPTSKNIRQTGSLFQNSGFATTTYLDALLGLLGSKVRISGLLTQYTLNSTFPDTFSVLASTLR